MPRRPTSAPWALCSLSIALASCDDASPHATAADASSDLVAVDASAPVDAGLDAARDLPRVSPDVTPDVARDASAADVATTDVAAPCADGGVRNAGGRRGSG